MTQFLLVYRQNSPQPENEILEGGPCRGAVTQPYRATLKHGTLSTREPGSHMAENNWTIRCFETHHSLKSDARSA